MTDCLLLLGGLLALRLAAQLLVAVAALLDRLASRQAGLAEAHAGLAVVGLVALQGREVVIDQTEAGGLATTKLRLEAEDGHLVLIRDLVEGGKLLAHDLRRHRTAPLRVVHLHDELLAVQQLVHLELGGPDGHLRLLLLKDHGCRDPLSRVMQFCRGTQGVVRDME